jgi:putative nucleotidyltransferase with HDIG domain
MPLSNRRPSAPPRSTLAAVALLSAGWALDAWRRRRRAARLHRALVDLLLNAISAGDPVTERHSRRVANLTDALGESYGMDRAAHARLRLASLLHDMGKIDDRFFHILHSCEPLSDRERESIEEHPHQSAHILRPLERIHPGITRIVESHHECWDGDGYPRGLQGEEIPLEARIISAADVFDALTQPRAYHDPLSVEEALGRIRASACRRFDPDVVRRLENPSVRARWAGIARAGRREEARAAT